MTNGELLAYDQEIQTMVKRKSVFAVWMSGKIKAFYEENGMRVRVLYDKMKQLDEEFFEYQDGKPKTTLLTNKHVFKSGKTDEQWKVAVEKLMNQEINIIL